MSTTELGRVPASSQLRLAGVLPVRQLRAPLCRQRGLEERLESLPSNRAICGQHVLVFSGLVWSGGAGNLFQPLASQNLGKY